MAVAETESIEKSYAAMRKLNITSLGNIPLVVLSRGRRDPLPDASEAENRQYEEGWKEMQTRLVALSPRGRQVIAEESQHYIQLTQPQIVIDAIRKVARLSARIPPGSGLFARNFDNDQSRARLRGVVFETRWGSCGEFSFDRRDVAKAP